MHYSQFCFTQDIFPKGINEMDIEQLNNYVELSRVKNFTEAGFICNLSQGALSKQIHKLEQELNVSLINRSTRRYELTEEGRIFLDYAEKALELYRKMLDDIHSKKTVRIGSMSVLSPYHIVKEISEFQKQYPDVSILLDEQPADQILAHAQDYDFMILRSLLITDSVKYRSVQLYDDYLCAIVYDTHPLSKRGSIRLEELRDEYFIFPVKGSGGYEAFYESCRNAGFIPDIRYEFPQANTIMSCVREKMGVTVNFTKVYQETAGENLVMIPLENAPHYPISLVYPAKAVLSDEQKYFIHFMKNALKK